MWMRLDAALPEAKRQLANARLAAQQDVPIRGTTTQFRAFAGRQYGCVLRHVEPTIAGHDATNSPLQQVTDTCGMTQGRRRSADAVAAHVIHGQQA
jgi:hypothetical protein